MLQEALEKGERSCYGLLHANAFKSSTYAVAEPVTKYLELQHAEGYNKFCIDCKVKETTHVLVCYGIFVCRECGAQHRAIFGQHYIGLKPIFNVHWDDYQLMSLSKGFGGNKPLFDHLQYYKLDD